VHSHGCLHSSSPTVPSQKWGVRRPKSYRGILDEARIHKHNTESIQYHNYVVCRRRFSPLGRGDYSYDVELYASVEILRFRKNVRFHLNSKISFEVSFGASSLVNSNTWNKCVIIWRARTAACTHLHQWRAPARISALKAWIPTDGFQRHHQKRERETCTPQGYKKCKAWATTLSKTYPSWPQDHKTMHANASKVI
jgi:hypothetical protein